MGGTFRGGNALGGEPYGGEKPGGNTGVETSGWESTGHRWAAYNSFDFTYEHTELSDWSVRWV